MAVRRKSSARDSARLDAACDVVRYGIRKAQESGAGHLDVISADRWMVDNCDFSDFAGAPRRRKSPRRRKAAQKCRRGSRVNPKTGKCEPRSRKAKV